MSAIFRNSCHKIKGRILITMRAIKIFDIILFVSSCVFCLLTFHEASVKKTEEIIGCILMPRPCVIQRTPLKIDLFLDFWWSCSKQLEEDFSWIFSKKLNEICNVLSCMSHWVLLFFYFFLTFHEASAKKTGRNL